MAGLKKGQISYMDYPITKVLCAQVFINKVATYVPYSKLFKKDFRNRVLFMKISPLKCLFIDKHS